MITTHAYAAEGKWALSIDSDYVMIRDIDAGETSYEGGLTGMCEIVNKGQKDSGWWSTSDLVDIVCRFDETRCEARRQTAAMPDDVEQWMRERGIS